MKAQMLKIAGVKSEKEFYKKFPDEASFMKAHGKEFKKAMRGSKVNKAQMGIDIPIPPIDESTIDRPQTPTDYSYLFEDQGAKQKAQEAERDAAILGKVNTSSQNFDSSNPTGQDLTGMRAAQAKTDKRANFAKNASPYIQAGSDVARGIGMIKEQKKKVKQAQQTASLTGLQSAAIASKPMQPLKNQYVTPWDKVVQPDQRFPSYGVGTNVLAEDGAVINQIGGNPTEIMNTFAPNTIYTDMGYEPLSDSSRVKQYQQGGQLYGMMNDSKFGDVMNQGGGDVLNNLGTAITGEEDAGTAIGGGIGQAAGQFFLGPIGGKVGKVAGKLIGDLVDTSERKIKNAQKQTRKNRASIIGSQVGTDIQNMYSANVRDGGIIKAQNGKDLTQKDGKCAREEAQNRADRAQSKVDASANAAWDRQVAAAERQAARQSAQEMADYLSEGFTGYGDKIKKKDFEAAYQTFATQNPELAKDRLLYTLANKELNKVRNNPDYLMRNVLRRTDPNLDYKTLTLPQLMQTMQKGYGSGQGYYDAWKEGFPMRQSAIQQVVPVQQENGGQTSDYQWVSHTWQPQVITHFGEHRMRDLLRPPQDADMLRTGGSIRQNYISPEEEMLTQMSLGGQLQTTWGGYAEPISQNPYLPSSGQTVMFRGQSHDESDGKGRTGIGVKYGKPDSYTEYAEYGTTSDADVEVERNEPAVELPGADGENNMVVYGNLKIPNQFLHEIGDPKAKGKKFKTYVKDLAKKEQRQNKIIDSSSEKLDDLNPSSPFDMLKFNSLAANIKGANMKLKEYADFKTNAASVQNAINDTAEELGLDADTLAKGKVAMAKRGANVPKAQDGKKLTKVEALATVPKGQTKSGSFWGGVTQQQFEEAKAKNPWYDWKDFDPSNEDDVKDFQRSFNKEAKKLGVSARIRVDGAFGKQTVSARSLYGNTPAATTTQTPTQSTFQTTQLGKKTTTTPTTTAFQMVEYEQNPLIQAISSAIPYLRPSDVEELDPSQLTGELYALSQNQVEPVFAQKAIPRLDTPYDISLQDILNENRATLRRQQQLIGYNPAAQSSLAAGEYEANQKVLAEQFRLNQAKKDQVYSRNREILNQYDMTNLGILGQQADRQAQALSKTKATTQEALNSISSKIAQNKLDNRTLATMENLYNYRYDPAFRAINMNAPYQASIPTIYVGPDGKKYTMMQQQNDIPPTATPGIVPSNTGAAAPSKNGSSVKKRKEALNSTVVRGLKNL
jgi:hypothetical protein